MRRTYGKLAIGSLLLIFFIPFFGMSQSQIGINTGVNFCKLSGDAPNNAVYKSNPGFLVGANYDFHVSKAVLLSFQPSYTQEGTKVFYNVPKVDSLVDSINLRMNYLSLPILLKVLTEKERFYAVGGIETGFLVNATSTTKSQVEDVTDIITSWNLTIIFGAGYRIPLGKTHLCIEARYSQGLVNLTEETNNQDLIPRVKTNGFKLILGYEIPLTKSN